MAADDIWRDVTVLNRPNMPTRFKCEKTVSRFIRPLAGVLLGLGLVISGTPNLSAQAAEQVISNSAVSSVSSNSTVAIRSLEPSIEDLGRLYPEAVSSKTTAFPANGIYLYGQSPQPEQIGEAYAVMEIINNQAVGAFYMPQSSFDCFYGSVESDNLSLNVVSSYDQATHEYSVAFQDGTAIASADGAMTPVQLVGYHPIDTVSQNDHRILSVCRTNFGE